MNSFKLHSAGGEKATVMSRNRRRIRRITTLFRYLELLIFLLIAFSRFSAQFAFSLNLTSAYLREVLKSLISPRFVFLVGNAIVLVLFLLSGRFSPGEGGKAVDFYDEYAGRSRSNRPEGGEEERNEPVAGKYGGVEVVRKMSRCRSEVVGRAGGEGRRDLRRSVSEKRRGSGGDFWRRAEEEMSSEEFRRTVEAFIARQQRILREEEEGFTAGVST